jgi:DNA-3-methyladenine glycosylase II
MHQIQGTLTPRPPFDFNKSLEFLRHFRPAMGQQTTNDGVLTKASSLDGQVFVFQVSSIGTIDHPELAYRLFSQDEISSAFHDTVRQNLSFFLSIDDDLTPFYALAEEDTAFEPVMQELYGYHQVKFSMSAFENAVWAILSQRNLMAVSRKMKDGLTERYGSALTVDGTTYRAFPEAFQLALASTDDINEVVRNLWKSQGVSNVAKAFDGVDESWLRSAPYAEVEKWLLGIKGIGAWSASFILLRGLGHMNQLPVGEKWLLQAARRFYGNDLLEMKDLERLAQPYGDYAGYWAHYLRAAS